MSADVNYDPMRATYDEDNETRRRLDAICENAIAAALIERFGFVPLSLRYRLAQEAVQACRAEVEPMQQRIRAGEAGGAA